MGNYANADKLRNFDFHWSRIQTAVPLLKPQVPITLNFYVKAEETKELVKSYLKQYNFKINFLNQLDSMIALDENKAKHIINVLGAGSDEQFDAFNEPQYNGFINLNLTKFTKDEDYRKSFYRVLDNLFFY